MAEPKRFQSKREPLRFFIDDDEFLAPPSLPAGTFVEFTQLKSRLRNSTVESAEQQWQEILGVFEKVLLPESFELFQRRIRDPYKDRKSTRLNSSHVKISYAVFCLKKKIVQ